jgi:hypothetical protein
VNEQEEEKGQPTDGAGDVVDPRILSIVVRVECLDARPVTKTECLYKEGYGTLRSGSGSDLRAKPDGENKGGSVYVFRSRSPHGRSPIEQGRRTKCVADATEKASSIRETLPSGRISPGWASSICVRDSSLENIRTIRLVLKHKKKKHK